MTSLTWKRSTMACSFSVVGKVGALPARPLPIDSSGEPAG